MIAKTIAVTTAAKTSNPNETAKPPEEIKAGPKELKIPAALHDASNIMSEMAHLVLVVGRREIE